jgi:hypothetical protein
MGVTFMGTDYDARVVVATMSAIYVVKLKKRQGRVSGG